MSTPPPGCPRAASAPFERETVLRKPTRVGKRSPSTPDRSRNPTCVGKRHRLRHSTPRKPTQVGKRSPSTPDRSRNPTCVGKRHRLRHSTPPKPTCVGNAAYGTAPPTPVPTRPTRPPQAWGRRCSHCVEATRTRHSIPHPSPKGENRSFQVPLNNQNSPLDIALAALRHRAASFGYFSWSSRGSALRGSSAGRRHGDRLNGISERVSARAYGWSVDCAGPDGGEDTSSRRSRQGDDA